MSDVHARVQKFYARKMAEPDRGLCCAGGYEGDLVAHIPESVRERAYGCGNPVGLGVARPGDTVLDLGAGAGIDCFIAAKLVGPEGRVIGLDMTDASLAQARRSQKAVAKQLGYDNVEFKKGYMEEIPLPDASVDLVISNCVVNLSPRKDRVFAEIGRVLKPGGAVSVSDIVAEREIPPEVWEGTEAWEECVAGAQTVPELFALAAKAGLYLVLTQAGDAWRAVPGTDIRVHSATLQGYRLGKAAECLWKDGLTARYLGPLEAICDSEGHVFPRGVPVAICSDTLGKLSRGLLRSHFFIHDPDNPGAAEGVECAPTETGRCC
jgi:SAM-dependent methyltransferase